MNSLPSMNVKVNTDELLDATPLPSLSSVFIPPDALTARQIQKLKKKKQHGLLTQAELLYYKELLAVKVRYALPLSESLLSHPLNPC